MESNLIRYFQGGSTLDQLSVTEIEQRLTHVPSGSIYNLLFAKKMSSNFDLNFMLISQDRIMMHYMLENDGKIPSLHDLKVENPSSTMIDDQTQIRNEDTEPDVVEELEQIAIPVINADEHAIVAVPDLDIQIDEEPSVLPEHVAVIQAIETENPIHQSKDKKKKKFKLQEFGGISDYAKWLMSFKEDDIDQKIKKEEKAAKKRKLEESARKSITKSNTIVSEPLAEILAIQGHLDDAKKMYEQLMMKYPEKSSYFAAKINLLIKN
jgi:hypothetical protein